MGIWQWEFMGAVLISFLGGGFFTVFSDSSLWKRLRVFYFLYTIFSIVEYFVVGNGIGEFFTAKCVGILAGIFFMAGLSVVFTRFLQHQSRFLGILCFLLGVQASFFFAYREIIHPRRLSPILAALFLLFSFLLVEFFHPSFHFKNTFFKTQRFWKNG